MYGYQTPQLRMTSNYKQKLKTTVSASSRKMKMKITTKRRLMQPTMERIRHSINKRNSYSTPYSCTANYTYLQTACTRNCRSLIWCCVHGGSCCRVNKQKISLYTDILTDYTLSNINVPSKCEIWVTFNSDPETKALMDPELKTAYKTLPPLKYVQKFIDNSS